VAFEIPGFKLGTQNVVADLSANTYFAVTLNTSGQVVLCSVLGEFVLGVLQNEPSPTTDPAASVMVSGVSKARCGAAITAKSFVTTNAAGKFITAASGHRICGVALETTTAADQIFALLLLPGGLVP
jgi:hypothetical protein